MKIPGALLWGFFLALEILEKKRPLAGGVS
jgi:hypothetical protein